MGHTACATNTCAGEAPSKAPSSGSETDEKPGLTGYGSELVFAGQKVLGSVHGMRRWPKGHEKPEAHEGAGRKTSSRTVFDTLSAKKRDPLRAL